MSQNQEILTFEQQTNFKPVRVRPSVANMFNKFTKLLREKNIEYTVDRKAQRCVLDLGPTQKVMMSFSPDYITACDLHRNTRYDVCFLAETVDTVSQKLYRYNMITMRQLAVLTLEGKNVKEVKQKSIITRSDYLDAKIMELRKKINKGK